MQLFYAGGRFVGLICSTIQRQASKATVCMCVPPSFLPDLNFDVLSSLILAASDPIQNALGSHQHQHQHFPGHSTTSSTIPCR